MSELPQSVKEAGLLFRRGDVQGDLKIRQEIIDWGYAQIDAEYPEDPLRAPLNVVRRVRARQEWERVIRTAGKELRGVIANLDVKELEFQIERRRAAILAEDAEKRRQEARIFDTRVEVDTHLIRSQIDVGNQKELLTHQHTLNERAEDAASERRIKEMREANEGEIARIGAEAVARSVNSSSAEDIYNMVQKINAEVRSIRNDPDLSNDDKHSAIKTLLENLPNMIYQASRHGH